MKRRNGLMKAYALIAAAALMLSGCGDTGSAGGTEGVTPSGSSSAGSTDEKIVIGASFPLTGTIAADGQTCVDAINLAIKQANEAGGINGREIALVQEDDEGSPTSAASIANKFVDKDEILAVVSSYNSSCMLAQVDIYKSGNLPAISPVATTPALTGCSEYFYRTAPNDSDCGSYAAEFLSGKGITKVALFYENDDYGLGIAEPFQAKCGELGIEVVTVQTYVYGETVDYSTQLTATGASGAEAIFIAGCVTEQGLICDQRDDYGCGDMLILCGNGGYAPALLGYDTDGVYVQGEFDNELSEKAKDFMEAFKAEYGYEPGNWAASAYDATMIVIEAMKNCDGEITRESINEQISAITYEGVCGTYTFENCNSAKEELMFQIIDGKFVHVE